MFINSGKGVGREDAVVKDKKFGQYANPDLVRQIFHKGKYFTVPGPHLCEPSRQRTPLLFQAGSSKAGKEFGAKHGEAIYVTGQLPEFIKLMVNGIRALARDRGRNPSQIKIMAGMTIIVAKTDEAAQFKKAELLSYGDSEGALALFGGWTGIDLSVYGDDEDFRFAEKDTPIRSAIDRWSKTVPGGENLPWNKSRIAEYLILGGSGGKAIGESKNCGRRA